MNFVRSTLRGCELGTHLRGRANVVHTPHIAGRTRDANLRVADVIADDFARIMRGEALMAALTPEAMRVRTEDIAVPGA